MAATLTSPLAAARAIATNALHRIALGADPSVDKQDERNTFGDTVEALVDAYAVKAQRKKSWKEQERILRHEVVPAGAVGWSRT